MKRISRFLLIMIGFYAMVAVAALFLLNGRISVLSAGTDTPGAEPAVLSQTVIGEPPKDKEVRDELPTIAPIDEEEEESVPIVKKEEELPTIEPMEEEEFAEDAIIKPEEEEEEEEPEDDDLTKRAPDTMPVSYYRFVVRTVETPLRLREMPSESAEILERLGRGDDGYILKPGNEWSYVVTKDGTRGYCATRYLDLEELTKDTFPAAYADEVLAPEEELTDIHLYEGPAATDAGAAAAAGDTDTNVLTQTGQTADQTAAGQTAETGGTDAAR